MKILMLGWEFPPLHSGGLGVATKNLAMAMTRRGTPICFALPHFAYKQLEKKGGNTREVNLISYNPNIEIVHIKSGLSSPYHTEESYHECIKKGDWGNNEKKLYGDTLYEEVERYAVEMDEMAKGRDFSLVHGHDWMTYPAACHVQKRQDKPFIAHVHATEMDRTGGNPNQKIYDYEKKGLEKADKIIAVSHHTKNILQKDYGLQHKDISVVHNGIEQTPVQLERSPARFQKKKTVLFLGRLTIQKGPDWLIKIAKKVLEKEKNIQFLVAGSGHMLPAMLDEIAVERLQNVVIPLGFLNEVEREKAFAQTDVYIMPSVSEPFGLSAVEAAQRGIPVIMSKQSGAHEILTNSLVADFWDVEKMAHLVLSSLQYPSLHKTLSEKGMQELQQYTWDRQASVLAQEYAELL